MPCQLFSVNQSNWLTKINSLKEKKRYSSCYDKETIQPRILKLCTSQSWPINKSCLDKWKVRSWQCRRRKKKAGISLPMRHCKRPFKVFEPYKTENASKAFWAGQNFSPSQLIAFILGTHVFFYRPDPICSKTDFFFSFLHSICKKN